MKLFVDDVRFPGDVKFRDDEWTIARTYEDALELIKAHKPQRIAFDHDLAQAHYAGDHDEKTGYHLAMELVRLDMDEPDAGYITQDFTFSSHSMNPDGKRRILMLLRRYVLNKYGPEHVHMV